MKYEHLFGPVRSRRLGISLGVDMIPLKTCNCNCIYCECGGAKTVSHERKEYVPANELIIELQHYLETKPQLDYVTFAGSGEPTLNTALGTVIRFVKSSFPHYKTALLTNGTLLHIPEVCLEIIPCDLVLPSLDAISENVFQKINRPYPNLNAKSMIGGLITFSRMYHGQLWVEVFIVPGINDTPEELALFRETLLAVNPARVQLNILDRPGACDWVQTAEPQQLADIAEFFRPLPVEIISRKAVQNTSALPHPENLDGTILHQLQRRPATIEEIAVMCGTTINEINATIDVLIAREHLTTAVVDGRTFYAIGKTG